VSSSWTYRDGETGQEGLKDEVLVGGATEFASSSRMAFIQQLDQGLAVGLSLDDSEVVGDREESQDILGCVDILLLHQVSLKSLQPSDDNIGHQTHLSLLSNQGE
jgi:hypothetical protein